jgi:hypothetical protein
MPTGGPSSASPPTRLWIRRPPSGGGASPQPRPTGRRQGRQIKASCRRDRQPKRALRCLVSYGGGRQAHRALAAQLCSLHATMLDTWHLLRLMAFEGCKGGRQEGQRAGEGERSVPSDMFDAQLGSRRVKPSRARRIQRPTRSNATMVSPVARPIQIPSPCSPKPNASAIPSGRPIPQ